MNFVIRALLVESQIEAWATAEAEDEYELTKSEVLASISG